MASGGLCDEILKGELTAEWGLSITRFIDGGAAKHGKRMLSFTCLLTVVWVT